MKVKRRFLKILQSQRRPLTHFYDPQRQPQDERAEVGGEEAAGAGAAPGAADREADGDDPGAAVHHRAAEVFAGEQEERQEQSSSY